MTPKQKAKLLSLVREYGDAEVGWARRHQNYIWSEANSPEPPSNKLVVDAFEKIVDFVHKL